MNWIDAISLGVIGVLAALGAWSGLIKAIFRLLSVLAASAATWFGTSWISTQLTGNLDVSPSTIKLIAGSVLFLFTLIGVLLIGKVISKAIAMTPMGIADRIGGALLGTLKASIILLVILNLLLLIPAKGTFGQLIRSSQAISLVKHFDLDLFNINWDQLQQKGIKKITTKILEKENPLVPPKETKKFDF